MSSEQKPPVYTINQVVAINLRLARELNKWTQAETCERLAPYLGERWSVATYSAAERSAQRTDRIRNFSANDIVAFAAAFGLPVQHFFGLNFFTPGSVHMHLVAGDRKRALELDRHQYNSLLGVDSRPVFLESNSDVADSDLKKVREHLMGVVSFLDVLQAQAGPSSEDPKEKT